MSKSPARWDPEKLKWMNGEYLRRLSDADLAERLKDAKPEVYKAVAATMDPVAMTGVARNKIQTLSDHENFLVSMAQPQQPDAAAAAHLNDAGRDVLRTLISRISTVEPWAAPQISARLKEVVAELKVKMPQVMMPFRVALTGQAQTPPIDAIAAALRKEVVLQRLERVVSG